MENQQPCREGDELTLDCVGVGAKGDGICKVEGFVIIVKGAQAGQRYDVRITKMMDKFGFAEIITG